MRSPGNPGFGSIFGRLFPRTVPEFTDNILYAWLPLVIPVVVDRILTELDQKDKCDFERPRSTHGACEFKEYGEVSGILEDRKEFRDLFLNGVSKVIHGPGFFLAIDTRERRL